VSQRPAAVAFDVIGTLMSLEPLRDRLPRPDLLEAWYTRTLRDGMALSASGGYADFPDVAAAALRAVTDYTITDPQVARVMAGFAELPAFPDVQPAVQQLHVAGVRVVCLTNGTANSTGAFLDRTGLRRYVERVISVAEVGRWKPATIVYRYAAEVLDLPPDRVALVAAHDWDCHGAKAAGLITGWVSRKSGGYNPLFLAPDVTESDLGEVTSSLLAERDAQIG
jgi:2-haloacid dehalogenase